MIFYFDFAGDGSLIRPSTVEKGDGPGGEDVAALAAKERLASNAQIIVQLSSSKDVDVVPRVTCKTTVVEVGAELSVLGYS